MLQLLVRGGVGQDETWAKHKRTAVVISRRCYLCYCQRRGGLRFGSRRCCSACQGEKQRRKGGGGRGEAPGAEYWDVIGELSLEDGVKVLAAADCDHGVSVGELGEYADFVAVLELSARCHCAGANDANA